MGPTAYARSHLGQPCHQEWAALHSQNAADSSPRHRGACSIFRASWRETRIPGVGRRRYHPGFGIGVTVMPRPPGKLVNGD
jgi:hypothetical protein